MNFPGIYKNGLVPVKIAGNYFRTKLQIVFKISRDRFAILFPLSPLHGGHGVLAPCLPAGDATVCCRGMETKEALPPATSPAPFSSPSHSFSLSLSHLRASPPPPCLPSVPPSLRYSPRESKPIGRLTASSSPSWCAESSRDRPGRRQHPRHHRHLPPFTGPIPTPSVTPLSRRPRTRPQG